MAKNAPFQIKSPVKNFHGPAKGGGHCTVALPLNMPLYTAHKKWNIRVYADQAIGQFQSGASIPILIGRSLRPVKNKARVLLRAYAKLPSPETLY